MLINLIVKDEFLKNKVLLFSPGWPGTSSVYQFDPQLTEILLPVPLKYWD